MGGGVWGFGWIRGLEFLRTGGMGFAGGVGLGGSSFGLPGAADGELCNCGLGCSVVAAEALAEAEVGGEPGGALVVGEPGAAAALAGDDGEALTAAGMEEELGSAFVMDGALVTGGGLGTGGLLTDPARWIGPCF